jgi:hypothetical protein
MSNNTIESDSSIRGTISPTNNDSISPIDLNNILYTKVSNPNQKTQINLKNLTKETKEIVLGTDYKTNTVSPPFLSINPSGTLTPADEVAFQETLRQTNIKKNKQKKIFLIFFLICISTLITLIILEYFNVINIGFIPDKNTNKTSSFINTCISAII